LIWFRFEDSEYVPEPNYFFEVKNNSFIAFSKCWCNNIHDIECVVLTEPFGMKYTWNDFQFNSIELQRECQVSIFAPELCKILKLRGYALMLAEVPAGWVLLK